MEMSMSMRISHENNKAHANVLNAHENEVLGLNHSVYYPTTCTLAKLAIEMDVN